jgi:hypothetical protein
MSKIYTSLFVLYVQLVTQAQYIFLHLGRWKVLHSLPDSAFFNYWDVATDTNYIIMDVVVVVFARKFIFIIRVLKLFLNNGDNVHILLPICN